MDATHREGAERIRRRDAQRPNVSADDGVSLTERRRGHGRAGAVVAPDLEE